MKFATIKSKLLATVAIAAFLGGSTLVMAGQSSSETMRMAPQTTTRTATQTAPQRQPAFPARSRLSTRQMMLKLKPRAVRMGQSAAPKPAVPTAGTSLQAKPQEPPKYEIADCGTDASPMICCHHEAGDGSSCNLFKILCKNAGGTAQGDGSEAACSDW
jgi:hypothetical protein